jgi:hypothetical protein
MSTAETNDPPARDNACLRQRGAQLQDDVTSIAAESERVRQVGERTRQLRAAEYRRLAIEAGARAESSPLAHVREKHEQAAAQWTALAVSEERPLQPRLGQARNPKRFPSRRPFPQHDENAPCIT